MKPGKGRAVHERRSAGVALSVLVSGLDAEMARLGCKDPAMAWHRAVGAAWSGTSLPAGRKSSRWTWRWRGPRGLRLLR